MRVCGIEVAGNEAIISLLMMEGEMFHLPDCRVTRIKCENPDKADDLKYFQKTIIKLVEDYKVEHIVIRERMKKGKFAGGANGFKLEATLQLMDFSVSLMSPADQKAALKHYPMPISFAETGLKKFQETAFTIAFSYLASRYEW